jgi:hypothetical protein
MDNDTPPEFRPVVFLTVLAVISVLVMVGIGVLIGVHLL